MKNIYLAHILIVVFSFGLAFNNYTEGQNKIKCEEFPALAKGIKDIVPEGKALFVFEAKEVFVFDSDNENIMQPIKDGQLYKLLVSITPASGAITIQHLGADKAYINYGKFTSNNSMPALINGEVKYFKLNLANGLGCYDVTRQKLKEGATDFQGLYDKEALIIINVVPKDLVIQVLGAEITNTVPVHEEGRYKVYVKPVDQTITLKTKNYDDAVIEFSNNELVNKDVRYFHVETPLTRIETESFDPNVKVGSYSIESNPPGALILMTGRPDFNKQQYKTPYSIEGYKSGTEIITLSLNRYEAITDTILISSSKGKKSKYNLIPKFAYINCNIEPPIPISKVIMDGSQLSLIEDGKDYECPKGTHNIEINAPHFYSETRQMNLVAGKTSEVNITLRPKMGALTILPDENAFNAEVYLNEKSIGKLPLENYKLQEGDYTIRYSKKGLVTEEDKYIVTVKENTTTTIKNVKMLNTREIEIITLPETGATVYIDDKSFGKSNLTCKIGIGKHSIKIEKDHYESMSKNIEITENDPTNKFAYTMIPLTYDVFVVSKPPSADVYLDGKYEGETPITIKATHGLHSIKMDRKHYFVRTAIRSVSSSGTTNVKKVLFPDRLLNVNVLYGLDSWGFEVGGTIKYFSLSCEAFTKLKNNVYSADISTPLLKNTFTFDSAYFIETGQKYSVQDSSGVGFAIKAGIVLLRPFMMRIHVGYGSRLGFLTNEVYKAKKDLTWTYHGGNHVNINEGDLVRSAGWKREIFNSYIVGIEVPVFNYLNLRTDYWFNSEKGSGFVFGIGFNKF